MIEKIRTTEKKKRTLRNMLDRPNLNRIKQNMNRNLL